MPQKRANIIVSGYVQGVFFRAEAKKVAQSLNLNGFVKNLPNGNVEIIAEGEEKNLFALISWCKKGPEPAQVENVEVKWLDYTGEFKTFSIAH